MDASLGTRPTLRTAWSFWFRFGSFCQLWLSCHTFKWFLKLLVNRVLSKSTHVSLALPRKSESQAGLGPVTHLPESLETLFTVTLSFRRQWTEVASWTVIHNQSHCTECRLLHYMFFTQTTNCCPHCWPSWHQSAADLLICTAVASPRCHGTDWNVLMDHSLR